MDYIVGDINSNKTEYLIDMALKLQEKGENVIYITPEQNSLNIEKKFIELSDEHTIMNAKVYNFKKLAFKVLAETGKSALELLDETGKMLIIRKILEDNKENLVYYKSSINQGGFFEEICGLIEEFYSYGTNMQLIEETEFENIVLAEKLQDITLIFKEYKQFIEDKYISTEETLDYLTEYVSSSPFLQDMNVIVDGFLSLTPQEYKIIGQLMKSSKKMYIAFSVKDKVTRYDFIYPNDYYYEPKSMLNTITAMATDNDIKIENVIKLDNIIPENKDIKFLMENYFNYKKYNGEVENIKILPRKNKYEEIDSICENIIYLVDKKGYRYKDIGLYSNALEDYRTVIKGYFEDYNIPVFVDKKTLVYDTSLADLILNLFDVYISNFSYESVFALLKNELISNILSVLMKKNNSFFAVYKLETLENYVLQYGIKGDKWEEDKFNPIGDNLNDDIRDIVFDVRKAFMEILSYFKLDLTEKEFEVGQLIKATYNFMEENEVYKALAYYFDKEEEKANFQKASEYSQIWEKVTEVFEKIYNFLGDAKVDIKEFKRIIETGFKGSSIASIPAKLDEIVLGDINRSINSDLKVVFLVGVNEGIIPTTYTEGKLLNDSDRENLKESKIAIGESSKSKINGDELLLYRALTSGKEKLYLSYSKSKLDGNSLFPSILISKFKRKFDIEEDYNEYITNKRMLDRRLTSIIYKLNIKLPLDDNEKEIYSYYKNNEEDTLIKYAQIYANRNKDEELSEEAINLLYGDEFITSISKMEKYISCPFSYFATYNLLARERKIFETSPMDIGNIFHEILESFHYAIGDKDWKDVEDSEIGQHIDNILNDQNNMEMKILNSNERYKNYLSRIKKISNSSIMYIREQIALGEFDIYGVEVEFGDDEYIKNRTSEVNKKIVKGLEFNIDGKKIVLTGKIDRVDKLDTNEDDRYFRVIDYKSSSKKLDINEMKYGLQLQLILYLKTLIAQEEEKHGKAGGMFYFQVQNPIINTDKVELDEDNNIDDIQRKNVLMDEYKLKGKFIENIDIIKAMDKDFTNNSKVMPARMKNDGSFYAEAGNFTDDEFNNAFDNAEVTLINASENIFKGNIDVLPILKKYENNMVPCKYCEYKGICQIDLKDEAKKYKELSKVNKDIFKTKDEEG